MASAFTFCTFVRPHADALPLIITHWLAWLDHRVPQGHRAAHRPDGARRRDAADAFHVVCPSLTRLRLQRQADRAGLGRRADRCRLDRPDGRLGYKRYGAQGSDWGTSVSASLGQQDAAHVAGHSSDAAARAAGSRRRSTTSPSGSARRSRRSSTPPNRDSGYSQEQCHSTADHRVRARGLARGALRLDHREVLGLDRLRRPIWRTC